MQLDWLNPDDDAEHDVTRWLEGITSAASPYIAGIDEAGRGPLAGPVVCAAVVLPPEHTIKGLNDSKALSDAKREALYEAVVTQAHVGVAMASAERIDAMNILAATMHTMREACLALPVVAHTALVDGNRVPDGMPCPAMALVKGDARMACIAAASIVAKVTRDRLMQQADLHYPGYGLAKHKGYPTKTHREAVGHLGPSPLHRRSFRLTP